MDSISLELPPPLRTHEGGDHQASMKKPGEGGNSLYTHLDLSLGISSDHSATTAFRTSSCRGDDSINIGDHPQLPGFFSAAPHKDYDRHHHLTALHQMISNKSWLDQAAAAAPLHNGFIHPWSLAARQQKAVFEQATLGHKHHSSSNNDDSNFSPPNSYSNSMSPRDGAADLPSLSPPVIVGWPPLRAFWKSLGGSPSCLEKPAAGDRSTNMITKKPKLMVVMEKQQAVDEMMAEVGELRREMFVKVKMEGFAVGRKINLRSHDGYLSLSRALCKLFHNFLSNNYLNDSEDSTDVVVDDDFILLYEDNEGDQMLVGDIPWKLFITSVKKLYIAHNPKKTASGNAKNTPEASAGGTGK